jgi:hypothetical protein
MKNTRWYWNDYVSGWRLFGVWIMEKYFIGFSIVERNEF